MHDRASARIHGLTASGRALTLGLPAATGWKAIHGGFLLFRDDKLVQPTIHPALTPGQGGSAPAIQVDGWHSVPGLPGSTVKGVRGLATDETGTVLTRTDARTLAKILPEATGPIECVVHGPTTSPGYLVVAPVREGRALFVVQDWETSRLPTLLPHRVEACADGVSGGTRQVYLVQEGKIVRATLRRTEASGRYDHEFRIDRELSLPGAVPPPVSLTVNYDGVLYAVNGTDTIYRFTEDGVLDRRIEVEP